MSEQLNKIDDLSFKITRQVENETRHTLSSLDLEKVNALNQITKLKTRITEIDAFIASAKALGVKTQEEVNAKRIEDAKVIADEVNPEEVNP